MLILIDQCSKICIYNCYTFDQEALLMQVKDTIHIHPKKNTDISDGIADILQRFGADTKIVLVVNIIEKIISVAAIVFIVFSIDWILRFAKVKHSPFLRDSILVLTLGGGLSHICDTLFWGYTLDFICISKSYVSQTGNLRIAHITSDIKDAYLDIWLVLAIIYLIKGAVAFEKFRKDKSNYEKFKKEFKEKCVKLFSKKKRGIS